MAKVCLICKKNIFNLYNMLDFFEGRCVKVDLEGYFGVDSNVVKKALRDDDNFCKLCITSIRNLNELHFKVEKTIFERGDKGITLDINVPCSGNLKKADDKNTVNIAEDDDDICDKELLQIQESRELQKGISTFEVGSPKKDKARSSSAFEAPSEIPCGIDGCKFSYHSVTLINRHRQRFHNKMSMYLCTECQKQEKFITKHDLDMHLEKEHLERRICPFCQPGLEMKIYFGVKDLHKHIYTYHINPEKDQMNKSSKRKSSFKCFKYDK